MGTGKGGKLGGGGLLPMPLMRMPTHKGHRPRPWDAFVRATTGQLACRGKSRAREEKSAWPRGVPGGRTWGGGERLVDALHKVLGARGGLKEKGTHPPTPPPTLWGTSTATSAVQTTPVGGEDHGVVEVKPRALAKVPGLAAEGGVGPGPVLPQPQAPLVLLRGQQRPRRQPGGQDTVIEGVKARKK